MQREFFGIPVSAGGASAKADARALRAALEVLKPKPSPRPLIRIGGDGDGAYLLPDDLEEVSACYSPGVNNFKTFEDELADRFGIAAHMCDYSSDLEKLRTPLKPALQTFDKAWLDVSGEEDTISLAEWITRYTPGPTDDLMLQMDIEGAEYRNILATPDQMLRRFRIVVVELHGLHALKRPDVLRAVLGPFLEKMDRHFTCVHLHPNNASGTTVLKEPRVTIPNLLEATFLRRDRFNEIQEKLYPVSLPHPLDIAQNVKRKPPMFLDDFWRGRAPNDGETIRMLSAELGFTRRLVAHAEDAALAQDVLTQSLNSLFVHLAGQGAKSQDLAVCEDAAAGKPFTLSSAYGDRPQEGHVEAREPFFFHTSTERKPWIRIDLGAERSVEWLELRNRTDSNQDRAHRLFLCLDAEATEDAGLVIPVNAPKNFGARPSAPSFTPVFGRRARYVTIFAAAKTQLHLSAVRIHVRS